MTFLRRKTMASAALCVLVTAGTVTATESAVQASPMPKVELHMSPASAQSPYVRVTATLHGAFAGYGYWSQDPGGDINGDGKEDYGDSAIVYDGAADGWGLEVTVSGGDHADTRGHNAPYWSGWAHSLGAEGTVARMQVCVVRGDS